MHALVNGSRFRIRRWMVSLLLVAIVLAGATAELSAENWPAWRGSQGSGVASESKLPTEWSDKENVLWKVPLPERGDSTPIIWNDRIYITQAIQETNRREIWCFRAKDGERLWTSGVTYSEKEASHPTNPLCSPSPVTDGERVVAWFGSAGLYCTDLRGTKLWHRDLGKQIHMWGHGASPVLYKNLCILSFGPGDREFLIAVDKNTGKTVWEQKGLTEAEESKIIVPGTQGNAGMGGMKDGEEAKPKTRAELQRGAWGTPLLVKANGHDELVVSYPHRLVGYNPSNGKELWTCRGMPPLVYSSPIWGEGVTVILGGYFGASMAVRPGGQGDVTETHRVWHQPRSSKAWLGSGVIHDGRMFVPSMGGTVLCLKLATGEKVWEKRLGKKGGSWSSMVLVGDLVYASNRNGTTLVFRAGDEFEKLSVNSLNEPMESTIVPSGGKFYIRTHENLWCIGSKSP